MKMVFLALLSLWMPIPALTKWRLAAGPRRLKFASAVLLMIAASGLFVQEAQAVFGLGGATCTAQSKTAGTSLACTVATETLDAGNVAVLWFAGDNVATTDVTTALLTSVTDSVGGNTWTVRQCFTNGEGTAANGATTCVATSVLTNALPTGSTITANFTSITAKAIVVREFTIGAGSTIAVAGTIQTLANDNADPGAMTVGGLTSTEYLWIRSTALERANATWTATASHTTSGCNGTTGTSGASNMNICGEFRILTATTDTSDPTAGSNDDDASLFMAFREVALTTIADGTNPSNVTIAPSAAITDLDAFTLATSTATDGITALTVTLTGANSFESLSEVRITSNDNATTYFSAVANPASNTVSFSGGTAIPVTTTTTTFKVRITPKTHASMPVPPGLSYAVGGTVTAFTGTNGQSGTDSASATVTVDNLSPANVTGATGTAGVTQVAFTWTNPADADFDSVIVLRNTVAVADTPVEGTTYVVGNTIGTSVVRCVVATPTASCTDTGLTSGTVYHYRIFAKDSNGNYSVAGVLPSGSLYTPAPSSFNVVQPGANELTGKIFTKIAGQNFALDIVALDASSAIATDFAGMVAVEVVDNTSGGPCAGLPLITAFTNQTFTSPGDNGRHALTSPNTEANARKNAKMRVTFTTGSGTVTSCSSDNFAIRPNNFASIAVTDTDWQTAGTGGGGDRPLNNIGATGGVVHKAGRPFRIAATAVNGAGSPATTTNYDGSPTAVTVTLLEPTGCTGCGVGTLTPGAWSAGSGTVTTTTASYDNAGAFTMRLEDQTWAAVDNLDGSTAADRHVVGSVFNVGRFVPEDFLVATNNTPKFQTFGVADGSCQVPPALPKRSFTYIGQDFGYLATDLPMTLITARIFGGGTATNYSANLFQVTASGVTQTHTPVIATLDRVIGSPTVTPTTTSSQTSTVESNSTDVFRYVRSATTPQALFPANISLDVSVQDASNNAANQGIITSNTATHGSIAFDSGNEFRYGRLRILNAIGVARLLLPVTIRTEYWTGTGFAVNSIDHCTTLDRANVALGVYAKDLAACESMVNDGSPAANTVTFVSGVGSLKMKAPGVGNEGSVTLKPQLGTTAVGFNYCSASPGAESVAVAAGKSYLQGAWTGANYDQNPTARAAFGYFGAQPRNFIFFRENH